MNPDRIPAIVLGVDAGFDLEIAGLRVVDRLLVTLHRAGCAPVTVVSRRPLLVLPRSRAVGIEWQRTESLELSETDAIVAAGNLVVQVGDVKEVIQQQGQLAGADGNCLPLKFVEAGASVDLSASGKRPLVRACGVAERVENA